MESLATLAAMRGNIVRVIGLVADSTVRLRLKIAVGTQKKHRFSIKPASSFSRGVKFTLGGALAGRTQNQHSVGPQPLTKSFSLGPHPNGSRTLDGFAHIIYVVWEVASTKYPVRQGPSTVVVVEA